MPKTNTSRTASQNLVWVVPLALGRLRAGREAIEATNSDAGSYTIRFATAVAGKAIVLSNDFAHSQLSGGGVTVDGDIDGNGKPDVTIRSLSMRKAPGFQISSSGNRLHAQNKDGSSRTTERAGHSTSQSRAARRGTLMHPTRSDSRPTAWTAGATARAISDFGRLTWNRHVVNAKSQAAPSAMHFRFRL